MFPQKVCGCVCSLVRERPWSFVLWNEAMDDCRGLGERALCGSCRYDCGKSGITCVAVRSPLNRGSTNGAYVPKELPNGL